MHLSEATKKLTNHGFDRREGQDAMMHVVDKAINQNKIALIEGGTGIGKTFAYLIPAILKQTDGRKIIVSTATISLQEQLLNKDIQELERILGIKVNAKIAKGRRRYVCLNKLNEYHFQGKQGELAMFGIEDKPQAKETKDKAEVKRLQEDIATGAWNGDRDSLNRALTDTLWGQLTVDASRCTNNKCRFFRQCAFFRARKELAFADIIITNHDLLLSDLRLGSGALLPALEESIYIIDEAHHFPHKAVEHFSANTDLIGFTRVLEAVEKNLNAVAHFVNLDGQINEEIAFIITPLKQQVVGLFEFLESQFSGYAKDNHWTLFSPPDALTEQLVPMSEAAAKLSHLVGTIKRKISRTDDENIADQLEHLLSAWGFLDEKVHQFKDTLTMLLAPQILDEAPTAKWISERTFTHANTPKVVDYVLNATVTSATQPLKEALWEKRANAVILCSATLRSLGKFDNFVSQSGLLGNKGLSVHYFPSPFPYEKSHFIVPKMQYTPEGAMSKLHVEDVIQKLPGILGKDKAGTLVLFTSKWMMEAVYAKLPETIHSHVLKQGALSKYQLLLKHKAFVDKGLKSIIFGLESFAQGVDLPGKYCNHVIITKLPFKVPTTPIEKTRANWLEQTGKNPFMLHALPEASIRLTQYVGRLIRCASDVGKITILDRRIVSKFYGKFLLNNLPAFTKVIE